VLAVLAPQRSHAAALVESRDRARHLRPKGSQPALGLLAQSNPRSAGPA
jgi:hypothetical protein